MNIVIHHQNFTRPSRPIGHIPDLGRSTPIHEYGLDWRIIDGYLRETHRLTLTPCKLSVLCVIDEVCTTAKDGYCYLSKQSIGQRTDKYGWKTMSANMVFRALKPLLDDGLIEYKQDHFGRTSGLQTTHKGMVLAYQRQKSLGITSRQLGENHRKKYPKIQKSSTSNYLLAKARNIIKKTPQHPKPHDDQSVAQDRISTTTSQEREKCMSELKNLGIHIAPSPPKRQQATKQSQEIRPGTRAYRDLVEGVRRRAAITMDAQGQDGMRRAGPRHVLSGLGRAFGDRPMKLETQTTDSAFKAMNAKVESEAKGDDLDIDDDLMAKMRRAFKE